MFSSDATYCQQLPASRELQKMRIKLSTISLLKSKISIQSIDNIDCINLYSLQKINTVI